MCIHDHGYDCPKCGLCEICTRGLHWKENNAQRTFLARRGIQPDERTLAKKVFLILQDWEKLEKNQPDNLSG